MIYFIQAGDHGPIKIGFTARDPARRRSELQSDCPVPAALLGSGPGDETDEARLHREMAEHRIRGDWFRPHPDVLALIERTTIVAAAPPAPPSNIRTARAKLGETQAEFAARFGVDQATVHRWEVKGLPGRGPARMVVERILEATQ